MDTWEVTRAVFERVHALDPHNASKIVGMLLIHDNSDKEIIRLAFGPDHLLASFVARARAELAATPSSPPSPLLAPLLMATPSPPGGGQAGCDGAAADEYGCWPPATGAHRRSFSLSDAEAVTAVRPCVYFARGFCMNGASCRFPHVLPPDGGAAAAEREVAVMQRARAVEPAFAFPPSPKGPDFMFPQHQQHLSDAQRLAAAMSLGGEDPSRFSARSPRMNRDDLINSPAALQIYLTFPADSTFTEEDVSNYFSKYGPVQDVRIPYQQRRMFGFVTFVYPETVKLILSKGNPHFVCDARVLVKPYKEKGKVLDRFRNLQQPHRGEFPGRMTPTGFIHPRDPLQQQIGPGPRMLGDIANREAFLRSKLEEQRQAAELQQAIELQSCRFMGLQLLDLKKRGHHLGSPVGSPMSLGQTDRKGSSINGNGNAVHWEDVTVQGADDKLRAPAFSAVSETAAEGKREEQQKEEDGDGTPKQAVNTGEEKRKSGPVTAAPSVACAFQESGVDHNLPGSLLAPATKAPCTDDCAGATAQNENMSPHHVASSLFPPTSSLELSPYSCFFQVPRFTSGHEEAIGL